MEIGEESIVPSGGYGRMGFDSTIIGWKIYYGDGSIVISQDPNSQLEWDKSPSDNVMVILLFFAEKRSSNENYRRTMISTDYFWREETSEGIIYGQGNAFDPSIPIGAPIGRVKASKWLPDNLFKPIYDKSYVDILWE